MSYPAEVPVEQRQRVAVLGLGYVGCVTAACLAALGHHVTGVDIDDFKVRSVRHGRPPFYEPGLAELIRRGRDLGRLDVSGKLGEVLPLCDLALICVGTPAERNGSPDLRALHGVAHELAALLPARATPFVVGVRSTVWPGTCEEVLIPRFPPERPVFCVANPEFLREGTAIRDFFEPPLVVIGATDDWSKNRVAGLYATLPTPASLVSLRTAEMIKYACNAFHATKVTFANEVGAVANALDIPAQEVMGLLCRDTALNISPAYLRPGFAFGGSCLPKDLRALVHRSARLDLNLPLLSSVLPSNEEHLLRAIAAILDFPYDRIGFYGLAFKKDTDDLRDSASIRVLETLIGKGRNVRVFDPHARVNQVYGSNRRFLFQTIPHIRKLVEDSLDRLLNWAECLVLMQAPEREARVAIGSRGIPVFDLANGNPTQRLIRHSGPAGKAHLEAGRAEEPAGVLNALIGASAPFEVNP